ncbi:hypothetical protein [Pseudomonas eucalypticola]|uniref:CBM-cenC domain-containing protein n=1 Tax=Pseudomonas eucalypticola TaxID=2599595 RepID=A0A7D5HFD1_9PSED|nr:hypothetical protein [Pseudomonas eucalypticola]QKZ03926.1 hypothetical protein HWQ56_09070 [Pseudomonas eucalypticola]
MPSSLFSVPRPLLLAAQDSGGLVQPLSSEPITQALQQMGGPSSGVFRVHYDGVVIVQRQSPCVLPTPQIAEALCGLLDVNLLAGDAQVTVANWPAMAMGQRVWLAAVGVTRNGRALVIPLSDGDPVTEADIANGFGRSLPKTELEKLVPCSTLRLEMKVSFNPESCVAEQEAFRFPEGACMLALYRELTDFEDGTFNGWQHGPAASEDLTYFKIGGTDSDHYLYVGTPNPTIAGVILVKTFNDLKCGAPYCFRLSYRSTNNYTNTQLYLEVPEAGGRIAEASPITREWQVLEGTFVAPSSSVQLHIGNDCAESLGNDYHIDDIELVYAGQC